MKSIDIACPKCEAAPGDKCRTLTTGRTTDTHMDRYWDAVVAERRDDARRVNPTA